MFNFSSYHSCSLSAGKSRFSTSDDVKKLVVKSEKLVVKDLRHIFVSVNNGMFSWTDMAEMYNENVPDGKPFALPHFELIESVLLPPCYTVEDQCADSYNTHVKYKGNITVILVFKENFDARQEREQCINCLTNFARDNPHLDGLIAIVTDGLKFVPLMMYHVGGVRPRIVYENHCSTLCEITEDGTKVVNEEGLGYFWELLHTVQRNPRPLQFLTDSGNILVASEIIGIGCTCTVFKCHQSSGTRESRRQAFAVKLADPDTFEKEFNMNSILAEYRITPPILDYGKVGSLLIYPLCHPVVKNGWTREYLLRGLTHGHFHQLYEKLRLMHSLGILHRDIRPENAVILNDEAFFIGLGFSVKDYLASRRYCGTVFTASQRVLKFIRRGEADFVYTREDDLESFMKMYYWYYNPRPVRLGENNILTANNFYEMWKEYTSIPEIAAIESDEEKFTLIYSALFTGLNSSSGSDESLNKPQPQSSSPKTPGAFVGATLNTSPIPARKPSKRPRKR